MAVSFPSKELLSFPEARSGVPLHGIVKCMTGKSTLLAALAAEFDRPVLDLDRPDARAAAASDPGFIVSGPGPVLIDEFQHVPEILDAIKAELNTDTRPGRYVLTGSTRYSVLPQAQSLTGRAHVINVLPLSQGELHGAPGELHRPALGGPCRAAGDATASGDQG